jgi:alpha-amylase/alpha-mannosidase (GH57 family)
MSSIVIHAHFYQPPRENPWTGAIDREDSAHPYHDWNERIHAECYRANAFARIVDGRGRVDHIVNNYLNFSFNFGPTLLNWLETAHPEAYRRILEADRQSALRRHGHGNAIAQGYNHAILPLCNERDRRTQVVWGIADFRHRFGRDPEALWMPETACHDATLETLIEAGMSYAILSPHQAQRVRQIGTEEWLDVSNGGIDPRAPYRYFHRDGSGRSIALFFYDDALARAIAFENALASSAQLAQRLDLARGGDGKFVNVATDGESYGHHFHFGDRCIAYAL